MTTFSYTIFDATPATSGACEWPHHADVKIEATSAEEALSMALEVAAQEGESYGEYEPGYELYVVVVHGNKSIQGTYTIQG